MSKTVIITGGTSGIGLAAAKIFIEKGFNCALIGRSNDKARAALDKLKSDKAVYISADVSNVNDCSKVVNEAVRIFGSVDILVNSSV